MNCIKKFLNFFDEKNLFYIAFALFFFTHWMSQTSLDYDELPLLVVAAVLLLVKNFKTKYTTKELLFGFAIFGVGLCSWLSTGSCAAVWCAVIALSMKNVSLKKVMQIMLIVAVSVTTLMAVLSLCGVCGDIYRIYGGRLEAGEIRFHLGVSHPNGLHFRFFFITALIFGLFYTRLKAYHYGILMVLNAGLVCLTKSRTGFLCCVFLIAAMFIYRYVFSFVKTKAAYVAVNVGCAACILVSLFSMTHFNTESSIWMQVDKLTSGRLTLGSQCYATYGISLFGSKVEGVIFDMGISRLLIENGVFFFVILYAGMFMVMKYFYDKKQYNFIVIMTAFLVYSLSERTNLYAYFNLQIILMGYALWQMFKLDDTTDEENLSVVPNKKPVQGKYGYAAKSQN